MAEEHVLAPPRKGGAAHWPVRLGKALASGWVLQRPLVFALAFALGSFSYFHLHFEPGWTVLIALLLASLLVWFGLRQFWRWPALGLAGLILAALSAGQCAAKFRAVTAAAPVVPENTEPVLVEGWITGIDRGPSGVRLTLNVHAIAGVPADQTPRRLRMTHANSLNVAPGRFVRCYGVLRPPPAPSMGGDYDFRREAWFRGLGAVGYVMGRCRGGALGPPADRLARAASELASLRHQLAIHVNEVAGPRAGGFAAALMAGDRSFMEPADTEALRASGLAHLLAISGLHMGIVGGLVYLLMRRGLALIEPLAVRVAVQKPAAATALLASAAYLALSGASVSTQRAFIMAAIFFGAILFDRAALSLRAFAIAMIAVVVIHPESVTSPGFQMSFAATGALIATYEAWSRRRRDQGGPRGAGFMFTLKSLVVTSLVAGLATGPYALYHFGRVATFGFFANLLAMPVITFLSAPLAAATLMAVPFGLSDLPLRGFGVSLEWVLAIAHTFASETGALIIPDRAMPGLALAGFTAALAATVLTIGTLRMFLIGLFCALAMVAWVRAPVAMVHWAPSGDVYLLDEGGSYQRVGFAEGDGLGPMRFADLPVSGECASGACRFGTPGGDVTLHAAPPPRSGCAGLPEGLNLFAGAGETWCPGSLGWSEVSRLGGQTLYLLPGGEVRRGRALECRPRPWTGCQPP